MDWKVTWCTKCWSVLWGNKLHQYWKQFLALLSTSFYPECSVLPLSDFLIPCIIWYLVCFIVASLGLFNWQSRLLLCDRYFISHSGAEYSISLQCLSKLISRPLVCSVKYLVTFFMHSNLMLIPYGWKNNAAYNKTIKHKWSLCWYLKYIDILDIFFLLRRKRYEINKKYVKFSNIHWPYNT